MKNYDYAEIEAHIANARRMRSEVLGEYIGRAWRAMKRGMLAVAASARIKARERGRSGPCLPA